MLKLPRNLIYMLAAVVVLAILALWRPGTRPDTPASTPLTELQSSAVHHLQLERPGQPALNFAKGESGWTMEAPYSIRAHDFALQTLSSIVTAPVQRQLDLDPTKLASYGLEQPMARLVINNNLVLEFGGTEPLSHQRYVKFNDHIYLLIDSWKRLLTSRTEDFIDLALLPDKAVITAIDMPGLQVHKQGDKWQVTPKQEYSTDQVQFLLDNWNYQHANTVQPLSTTKTKEHVRITLKDQPAVDFLIISRKPFILGRPDLGLQYLLADDTVPELLQLPPMPSDNTVEPEPQQ